MRRAWIALPVILMFACAKPADDASVGQAGFASPSPHDRATVQSAIDAQLTRFRDAMLKGDTAGLVSAYTDDAFVLPAGAPIARGRAAIAQSFAGMLAAMPVTAFTLTTTDLLLAGDVAIETGTYQMSMKPKAGKAFDDVGKYISIWQRQPDGSWKMIRDIFNSDKPGA